MDARSHGHDKSFTAGVVDGRGWSVVELNGAWGAGIYQCDPEVVLDVVRAATIARPETLQRP